MRYRCHVCRLELVLDIDTGTLVPRPGGDEEAATPPPRPTRGH